MSARLDADYANVRAAVAYASPQASRTTRRGSSARSTRSSSRTATWARCADGSRRRSPQRDRLSDRGLAETLVAGGEIARFAGDLDRAIELKEELARRRRRRARSGRNWRAATLADLCEIALDRGDLARARVYAERERGGRRRARACRPVLRGARAPCGRPRRGGGERASRRSPHWRRGRSTTRARSSCSGRRRAAPATPGSPASASPPGLWSFAAIGDGGGMADCLDGLARLAVATGDDRAGRLHGAAERLRETRGRRPIRADLPLPGVPDAALAEGRAMTPEEAVDEALEPAASARSGVTNLD